MDDVFKYIGITEKIRKDKISGKIHCEYCISEIDPVKNCIENTLPKILICPSCKRALDEYGYLWE